MSHFLSIEFSTFNVCPRADGGLVSTLIAAPLAANAAPKTTNSLTQPVTGTVANGGAFAGTLNITQFANQNGQLVAIGTLTNGDGRAGDTACAGERRVPDPSFEPRSVGFEPAHLLDGNASTTAVANILNHIRGAV